MFSSVWIDDTTEEVSLLSWPTIEEGNSLEEGVEVNGLNIKWSGYKLWNKTTTQPIPRQAMTFEYSATIINIEEFSEYSCVKLVAGYKDLEYRLINGDILYGNKKIATYKGLTLNDTVCFSVRRLVLASNTLNLCEIRVNENKCCSELVIEGVDIFPAVYIKSPGVELNTAFSIGNTHAKEGMFIYFLNNQS